jgi:hypothetical protein
MNCFFCEGQRLLERLTFDQLMAVSEPKRVLRSKTVRGPPLAVDAKNDGVYYSFNFKAYPSTEKKRHKGYIKFFKPKKKTPLEKVECLVDCDCKDYKFRWAWANKQRGSSVVGSKSLNQAWNKAPKIANPTGRSGLCKHLLALRDFIYGEYENFDGIEGGTPERLDAVVKDIQSKGTKSTQPLPTKRPDKQDPKAWKGGLLYKGPEAEVRPDIVKPTKPNATMVRPKGVQKAAQKNQLPGEFAKQTQKRFSKVESVVMDVNAISQLIKEADEVQVDPEASEALQILRDIRDSLRILAAKEEEQDKEKTTPPPAEDKGEADKGKEGPTPDDLPEPPPSEA